MTRKTTKISRSLPALPLPNIPQMSCQSGRVFLLGRDTIGEAIPRPVDVRCEAFFGKCGIVERAL